MDVKLALRSNRRGSQYRLQILATVHLRKEFVVVSINGGTPMQTPKYYNPCNWDPEKGTPNFTKPLCGFLLQGCKRFFKVGTIAFWIRQQGTLVMEPVLVGSNGFLWTGIV